ncbi:hypothetical protein [Brevibacillus agri]|uniref:hypothetical protein n=1 Tax=Brevibacillus agri TaxID=51101 RepID=UPI003D24D232
MYNFATEYDNHYRLLTKRKRRLGKQAEQARQAKQAEQAWQASKQDKQSKQSKPGKQTNKTKPSQTKHNYSNRHQQPNGGIDNENGQTGGTLAAGQA